MLAGAGGSNRACITAGHSVEEECWWGAVWDSVVAKHEAVRQDGALQECL